MIDRSKEMKDVGYMRLTRDHVKKLHDHGFCYVEIKLGHTVKVTKEDICFNKDEIDALPELFDPEKPSSILKKLLNM